MNKKTARQGSTNTKTGLTINLLQRNRLMAAPQITDSRGTVKLFSCFLLAIIL